METTLPSPRRFLTSLVDTLASAASPVDQEQNQGQAPSPAAGGDSAGGDNPLKQLAQRSPRYRALLTTLHVLYPSVLLPALDVLDRRLATRVFVVGLSAQPSVPAQGGDHADGPWEEEVEEERAEPEPTFHVVRSSQHHGGGAAGGAPNPAKQTSSTTTTYVVRLRAWSCTCAAFAFAAYPFEGGGVVPGPSAPEGSSPAPYAIEPWGPSTSAATRIHTGSAGEGEPRQDSHQNQARKRDAAWQFGGLSIDGRDGDVHARRRGIAAGVPACKHLLACALAERLAGLGLRGYVDERWVSREEGAGLVADV